MNTVPVLLTLILFAIFVAGIFVMQIFLSKRESKWLGLILPFITFCISLIAVLGIAVYSSNTTEMQTVLESGEIVNQILKSTPRERIIDTASLIMTVVMTLLLSNIPTAILLAIYAACREKRKRKLTLDKMSVQDLG